MNSKPVKAGAVLFGLMASVIAGNLATAPSGILKLNAPSHVAVGQLVILDASESNAVTFDWKVLPECDFLVIENGRRAIFSGPAGKYQFILAGMRDGEVEILIHTLTVGGTPPPESLDSSIRDWYQVVNTPNKKQEAKRLGTSFKTVASQIYAGVLKTPDEIITSTASANRVALGSSIDAWRPFLDSLRHELNKRAANGTLVTAEQHAKLWEQIGDTLQGL